MVIECPNCNARYRIDDSKIPSKGITIPCKKCKTKLVVPKHIRKSVDLDHKYEERTSGTHPEVKAESLKYPRDSKDKLPIEVFVRTAIQTLREPPGKGIRMVHSGFADAFREYYSLDPSREVTRLEEEGQVVTKGEIDDVWIFLPEDAPISDTLKRILAPIDAMEPPVATPANPALQGKVEGPDTVIASDPRIYSSAKSESLSPVHRLPKAVSSDPSVKLTKEPEVETAAGRLDWWQTWGSVEQTMHQGKAPDAERNKLQLLLDQPLTIDSCVGILTLAGFKVQSEKTGTFTVASTTGLERDFYSFEDLCRFTVSTAKGILAPSGRLTSERQPQELNDTPRARDKTSTVSDTFGKQDNEVNSARHERSDAQEEFPVAASQPPIECAHSEQGKFKSMIEGSNFIERAWRGHEPLWKVFWIYNVLFYIIMAMGFKISQMASSTSISASLMISLVCLALGMVYCVWTCVAIWTCSGKSKFAYKFLARIYVIVSIVINGTYSLYFLTILSRASSHFGIFG